jgi:hypothetical protein
MTQGITASSLDWLAPALAKHGDVLVVGGIAPRNPSLRVVLCAPRGFAPAA